MSKHVTFLSVILFCLCQASLQGQSYYPVHFSFGVESFPDNFQSQKLIEPDEQEVVSGRYVRFIRTGQLIPTADRRVLEEKGVQFLAYISSGVYQIAIPETFDLTQLEKVQVRSILPVQPVWKLARNLRERPFGDWAVFGDRVAVVMQIYPHVTLEDAVSYCQKNDLKVVKTGTNAHFIQVLAPQNDLERIAALPIVQYMELLQPPGQPEDTRGRSLHRSNLLDSDAATGNKYNGEGVSVIVRDDGQVGPHIDFAGRLTNLTDVPPDNGIHGDGVTGILAGAGNLDPRKKGMASGAHIFAVDQIGDFQDATLDLFLNQNATITNTSYSEGNSCNGGYTNTARIVDGQMYQYPRLMHVFSGGNANGNDCGSNNYGAGNMWGNITGGHKQGKNSIAVANLSASGLLDNTSSRGPAYDGRIKPDISAHGNGQESTTYNNAYQVFSGTSAATPGIAGCLAQLTQAYKSLNNGAEPTAALLKTLLLNTAKDLGNIGPDFKHGWGQVNAGRAFKSMQSGQWSENTLDNLETVTQTLAIPEGVRQAKVMLYWPEASAIAFAPKALINDLDLRIIGADGTVYLPWKLDPTPDPVILDTPAGKGRDSLNNMEQVAIDNPVAGLYSIEVNGKEVPMGPQSYYLSWEFLTDSIHLTYPNGGEGFVPGETERIHWDAYGNDGTFVLTYSTDNGANWQTLSTVSGSLRLYDWAIPPIASGKVLIRIQRGAFNDMNDSPFSIVQVPQIISITKVCPDSMSLTWADIQDTLSYDVYLLGNKYMEIVASTPVNTITIPIENPQLEKWVSVRATSESGIAGRRAIAVEWPGGLKECTQPDDIAMGLPLSLSNDTILSCVSTTKEVSVQVKNMGINPISGAIINYQIDNQGVNSEPLPDIAADSTIDFTFQNGLNLSGNLNSILRIWTTYPTDDYVYNDTISFPLIYVTEPISSYFTEDFETSDMLPDGWLIANPDAEVTWAFNPNPVTGADGTDTRALYLNCFNYLNRGPEDYVYLRPLDLSNIQHPGISFDVSHASYNSTYNESLRLEVFPDCDPGATPVIVWQKIDPALATVPNSTQAFTPQNAQDWRTEYVDLEQFAGQSVFVRFASVNDYGNNLYLDNINLIEYNLEAPEALISAVSDSICRTDTIYFEAIPFGTGITQYAWSFGSGASPISATGPGPHAVRFLLAGNRTTRLIVTNLVGSDTAYHELYIAPLPISNFSFQSTDLNVTFSNTSQNATSYFWTFGDGETSAEENPMHTYAVAGNYTVTLSAINECRTIDKTSSVTLTTSVSDLSGPLRVQIIPNPTSGDFKVSMESQISGTARLSLLDAQGRLVKIIETTVGQSIRSIAFENLALAKGIYQLNIQTDSGFQAFKVVIQ